MSKLSNVKMWWSVDHETGCPPRLPKNVRLAYMQVETNDIPDYKVDLVFRVDRVRDQLIAKKVANALVCPVENGITKQMDCMRCGFCWRNKGEVVDWSVVKARLPLQLV